MNLYKNPTWKKNILLQNSKIKDAIKILNNNKEKIVIIVDEKKRLIGTITNGDIRRNLIKGYSKNDDVIYIINKKPVYVRSNYSKKKIINLFIKNKITCIPLIKKNKTIAGMYVYHNVKSDLKKDTIILIMAGGKGKRLLPLTKKTPKPMLKISGKPMVERLISKASKEGFGNFIFSVNYLSHKIINYFNDGKKWGVKIDYIKETKPLGTIGSLYYLSNYKFKNIIVINCDVVTRLNFNDLLTFHDAHKQIATVASIILETKNQFGVIKTKGSRLIEMVEKPLQKNYVNGGIYVFKKTIVKKIKKDKKLDITNLFKKIIRLNKKIIVYPLHEPWADIGIIKELNKIKKSK